MYIGEAGPEEGTGRGERGERREERRGEGGKREREAYAEKKCATCGVFTCTCVSRHFL
jgi:hypothetical protein